MRRTIMVLVTVMVASLVAVAPVLAAPASAPDAAPTEATSTHVVRKGETLFSIGRRYGVDPYAIAKHNGLRNPNCIYVGQCLRIPPKPVGCWQSWCKPQPRVVCCCCTTVWHR